VAGRSISRRRSNALTVNARRYSTSDDHCQLSLMDMCTRLSQNLLGPCSTQDGPNTFSRIARSTSSIPACTSRPTSTCATRRSSMRSLHSWITISLRTPRSFPKAEMAGRCGYGTVRCRRDSQRFCARGSITACEPCSPTRLRGTSTASLRMTVSISSYAFVARLLTGMQSRA
jgi:hypothetical protein